MKNPLKTLLLVSFFLSMSCGVLQSQEDIEQNKVWLSPLGFKEGDVVGVWENDDNAVPLFSFTEILIFRDDHTFTQIYTDRASGQSVETKGIWYVKSNPSGCAYIYADKMQYYEFGGNLSRDSEWYSSLWDICENDIVDMHDFVLLGIGNSATHEPSMFLYHMAVDMESTSPVYRRVSDSP